MERVYSDAFLTTPVFRSHQISETQQKSKKNFRQLIINILKTLTQKQILNQAINNIGIPKNFVTISYIESRPQQQLSRIYSTVCVLKKEVLRIRKSFNPALKTINNLALIQSHRIIQQGITRNYDKKEESQTLSFLKKQLEPETKIKLAIEKQLQYRQKLQGLEKKGQQAVKIKFQMLQKRKQALKHMNKKAIQVSQKHKQTQQLWFQKILQLKSTAQSKQHSLSPHKRGFQTANSTRRQQYQESVKEKLQRQKFQFESHLQEIMNDRQQKQNYVRQFKHRRLNSLNERMLLNEMKSQQIRSRKINTVQEEETQSLKKAIQKEHQFITDKKKKITRNNTSSDSNQGQNTLFVTNPNFFHIKEKRIQNFEKQDEKENKILQKLQRKNSVRLFLLNQKVSKIKEISQIQQSKRVAFKQTKEKLLTEALDSNGSFVYQKDLFGNKSSLIKQVQHPFADIQEQQIRRKHKNTLKRTSCEQAMLKLRKLPKTILQKKLKAIKNKELRDMLARDIVKFFI